MAMYTEAILDNADKPRKLRYEANAIRAIDIEMRKAGFGFTLLYFLNTCAKDPIFAEENIGLDLLTILLWGGLRWEDKGMTLDRTGEIINKYLEDVGDFGELTMLIMKALMESNIFKV